MRKIELAAGLVTILTPIVLLAVYFTALNLRVITLESQVKNLNIEKIREEQEQALKNFKKETEKVMEEAKEKIASVEAIENVRAIVTKSDVDEICSSVS